MSSVAIRADSSLLMGTGHIARCLSLADGLSRNGSNVIFFSRDIRGNSFNKIEAAGFPCHRLPSPAVSIQSVPGSTDKDLYAEWLEVTYQQELSDCQDALKAKIWDWLIVDHYSIDSVWEKAMRAYAKRILVIDDLANRNHDCDILIDQNYIPSGASAYTNLLPAHAQQLLGPEYALLRNEFTHLHKSRAEPKAAKEQRLFISFGGVDDSNQTEKSLLAALSLNKPNLYVDIVVGKSYPHISRLHSIAEKNRNVSIYQETNQIAEIMAAADIAIGAAGTTSWERCCLGLPTLIITVAENQIPVVKSLVQKKAAHYLGFKDNVKEIHIQTALSTFLNNLDSLKEMRQNAFSLVDGCGVERVIKKMQEAQT